MIMVMGVIQVLSVIKCFVVMFVKMVLYLFHMVWPNLPLLQVEMMHIFTKSNLDIPEVKHPIYAGSSSGDLIGPINLESYAQRLWQVTEDDKKKIYSTYRVAVGGATETAPSESGKRTQFKKNELTRAPTGGDESTLYEPFCYHGMPPDFYRDMFAVWSPKAIIDFTASDLTPGFVALECKTPYLGICFTEAHVVAGYKHLGELVYEAMLDEKSPLHDAKLCALLAQKGDDQKAAVTKKGQNKRKATADFEKPEKTTEKTAEENASGGASAAETKEGTEVTEGTDPKTAAGKKPRTSNGSSSSGTPAAGGGSSIDVLMNQLKNLRKT